MLEWSETSHLVTFNLDFRHDIAVRVAERVRGSLNKRTTAACDTASTGASGDSGHLSAEHYAQYNERAYGKTI